MRVAPVETAGEGDLSFLANPRYRSRLAQCAASALILRQEEPHWHDRPAILTPDPYLYFAKVARYFNPVSPPVPGIHPSAVVESVLPASVSVGPCAVIAEGVQLGEAVRIGAGVFIGKGVSIGPGSIIGPNVTIYTDCHLGNECVVHAGAIIGADGFGFAREKDGRWCKIPQTGRVVIGNEVEIGANTTIDRGAMGDTVIADGVKIDNLVQIAHNVQIGEHSVLAGCAGVAGSARIGARCMIGGQAGISGHIEIGDDVMVSAWTLVPKSLKKKGLYTATLPVQSHEEWLKNFAHLRHLDSRFDELAARLDALETRALKEEPCA
jgi:UDP-3-O-[3-hydroxymyristoyl] glucosamine N-acyltransferase